MDIKLKLLLILLILLAIPITVFLAQKTQEIRKQAVGANAVTAGTMKLTATFNSIGIELPFLGDDNGNATATLEFKKSTEPDTAWRTGLPLWRTQETAGPVAKVQNQGGQVAGIVSEAHAQTPLPVFPGAIGFGTNTPAGRGGTVYKVTNLNDSGPGSLRDCVGKSGPRVCVFEVSGVINLLSVLNISKPFITIAGQTAPPPGITLMGDELKVSGHDVLVQHIRTRVGVCCPGLDAVAPEGGAYNVVIDHVSAAWATDENMSAHGNTTRDITFLNSIMAEGLKPHSKGGVAKFSNRVAYINSLFVHNVGRNPKFGDSNGFNDDPVQHAQFLAINNLIYNWGSEEIKIDADGTSYKQVNFVGNVFKGGNNSVLNNAMKFEVRNGNQIYAADNRRDGVAQDSPSDWSIIQVIDSTNHVPLTSPPFPIPFTPKPSSQVSDFVLRNAGARPGERGSANEDPIDGRVVNDVKNGTGTLISNESEVGGLPTIAQNSRTLDLPPDPSGDSDNDGYTNLEEWLHGYSAGVEGISGPTPTPTPPSSSPTPTSPPSSSPIPTPTSTPAGLTGAFYGSALLLEQNTSYDIKATITDPDGVSGSNVVTGTISTRADNIPSVSTLTPTHFVDSSISTGGNGSSGSPWKTLQDAIASAPSGAVVEVAPGFYKPPASVRSTPITLKAKFPAVNDSREVINGGSHSVIEPNAVADKGTGKWTQVTVAGPGNNGATPGVNYKVWKWTGSGVNNPTQLGIASDHNAIPQRVAHWKTDNLNLDTPQEWAELLYTNKTYNYGFWSPANSSDIYVRLYDGLNPNNFWVTAGIANGIRLNGANSHVSGFEIRQFTTGIYIGGNASVVDHNLVSGNQQGIRVDKAEDVVIEKNYVADSNLWTDDATTKLPIAWKFIKQHIVATNNSSYPTNKIGRDSETHGFFGFGTIGKRVVIRNNTIDGTFNGVGVGAGDNRYAAQDFDIHDNLIMHIGDDSLEPENNTINWRIWNNRVENAMVGLSTAPVYYGPLYLFKNQFYKIGTLTGAAEGTPHGVLFKHERGSGYPIGKVYFLHNTVWTDMLAASGGTHTAIYLRNNLLRVTQNAFEAGAGVDEDYNHFATTDTRRGLKYSGRSYTTDVVGYRTASGQGAHTNLLGDFIRPSVIDNALNDPSSGNLTIRTGSPFFDQGVTVPNISDISGSNYQGVAPDIGACEGENCLAAIVSGCGPGPCPTPTPTPTTSPTPTATASPTPTSSPTPSPTSLPTPTPTTIPGITSTPTLTPTPPPTPFPGDIDGDRDVDIFDYNILVTDFGPRMPVGGSPADLDHDGDVDIFDYTILVENFGRRL